MNNIKLKANKLLFTSMFLLLQTHIISAQELYTYLGKSSSSLTVKLGKPDYESQKGTMLVYKYRITSNESQTFGIQNGKIITAIKSIYSKSMEKAKDQSSIQILYYMALGFTKQGKESGMTILKKGKRVLSIGWMDEVDGYYSTIVSAF
jgi:hypothetical protein